jgi:hypothetical protein
MLFKTLFGIAIFSFLAQAFVIPEGTSNGVYRTYVNKRGEQIHEKIFPIPNLKRSGSAAPTTPNPLSTLNTRQIDGNPDTITYCGCGYNMDHGNCDWVAANMLAQLQDADGFIPQGISFYAIYYDVVAFLCNGSTSNVTIDPIQFPLYLQQITGACGWYVAGTVLETAEYGLYGYDTLVLNYGYMIYFDGLNFCAAADTSPAHSC